MSLTFGNDGEKIDLMGNFYPTLPSAPGESVRVKFYKVVTTMVIRPLDDPT